MTSGELTVRVRHLANGMRRAGCPVGVAELADALLASQLVAGDLELQRLALRTTLARDPAALAAFDQLFPWLFAADGRPWASPSEDAQPVGSLGQVPLASGSEAAGEDLHQLIPAASELAAPGLAMVESPAGAGEHHHAWAAAFLSWADRFGGGRVEVGRRLDLRRTMRRSLATGGEPVALIWKRRPLRRQTLVLIDASRSMQRWANEGLQLARAISRRRPDTEVWAFSATTSRLSRQLAGRRLDLPAAAWGSGTRIGDAISTVLRTAPLARPQRLSTLIVSDGLEAGSVAPLAQALRRLRRRSVAITWANPLADGVGYRPLTEAAQLANQTADRYQGLAQLLRGRQRRVR